LETGIGKKLSVCCGCEVIDQEQPNVLVMFARCDLACNFLSSHIATLQSSWKTTSAVMTFVDDDDDDEHIKELLVPP
jgi:hypothetical protein